MSNFIGLKKGFHKFAFGYLSPTKGVNTIKLEFEGPDFAKQPVPMPWAAPILSANITTPTSGSVIVTVTPPATGYKVEYQIDSSGSWVVYSSPVTVTRNTTFQARATDSVGHISTVSQLVISNIN